MKTSRQTILRVRELQPAHVTDADNVPTGAPNRFIARDVGLPEDVAKSAGTPGSAPVHHGLASSLCDRDHFMRDDLSLPSESTPEVGVKRVRAKLPREE